MAELLAGATPECKMHGCKRREFTAEIDDLKSANQLLRGLMANRDAEIVRLTESNQRLRHLLRAYIDQGDTMRELAEKELSR